MKKLLYFILVSVMIMSFSACSRATNEARTELENIMNAFKSCDKAQINKYYSYDNLTSYLEEEEGELLSEAVLNTLAHMNYEVKGAERVNSTAVKFDVNITTVDFSAIMGAYIEKVTAIVEDSGYQAKIKTMQEEEYDSLMAGLMIDAINENGDKTATKSAEITMIKGETGWILGGRSDELLGILFENLSNAVESLV